MIEQLKNCPNCGAVLDDTGRCQFCGSKVYDLFDIDMKNRAHKYVRIKTSRGIVLAPIIVNTVTMEMSMNEYPTINMEFVCCGDIILQEEDSEHDKFIRNENENAG